MRKMIRLLLPISMFFIVCNACTTTPTLAPATATLPPPTPFLTEIEPASLPSLTASLTEKPAAAPSLTPQSLMQWAQSNQPDPVRLQKIKATYAQAMGISVESIRTEVWMRAGVNGAFVELVDEATGVPFFVTETGSGGQYTWQVATLKNIAGKRGMEFGSLLNLNRDFHSITIENFGTGGAYIDWNLVQPQKGVWDFSDPDYNIDNAYENGMAVQANLIWGKNFANWAIQNPDLHAVMIDYITQVMTHYKGKVTTWMVYNEAQRDENDIFWNKLGMQGVRDAYSTARAIDPQATLLYSDFVDLDGTVQQDRLPIIESVVSQVQQDGNLDGIGLQAVGRMDTFNIEKLRTTLGVLKKYGLPIYIQEFSVIIEDENTPENLLEQAQVGAEVMRVIRECECVSGVTTFALEDRLTNKVYFDNANAGFWLKTETGAYIPKPIVYQIMAVLASDD